MDLVRMILLRIEANPTGRAPQNLGIEGYPPDWVPYHAHIMKQDGLIDGIDVTTMMSSGPEVIPTGLTWKGHEFVELARDQERWNQAKAIIAKIGGAPISVWTKVLTDLMLQGVEIAATKKS
jgi:hypothetical protein